MDACWESLKVSLSTSRVELELSLILEDELGGGCLEELSLLFWELRGWGGRRLIRDCSWMDFAGFGDQKHGGNELTSGERSWRRGEGRC